jgi:hypothetical protein
MLTASPAVTVAPASAAFDAPTTSSGAGAVYDPCEPTFATVWM